MKPDGTPLITAGPEQVGRAALHGGTTTLIDFAYWRDGALARKQRSRPRSRISSEKPVRLGLSHHAAFRAAAGIRGELAEAIQAGYPTLKIFTTNILPSRSGRMIDFGDIWEAFQVLAKEGGLGVIHAEDNDIVMHMYAKLIREGRVGFEHLAEVHNALSEDLSFRRVLRLAQSVPGTALYMMHVSAATGVAAIAEARRKGLPVYGRRCTSTSTTPATTTSVLMARFITPILPSSRAEDQNALWARHDQRLHHTVATDELCCTLKDKTVGNRIDDTTGGNSGVEPRLASCTRRWWSAAAIRSQNTWTLFPPTRRRSWAFIREKAQSRPAATPISPFSIRRRRGQVRAADLHETDYTPWEGHDIFAWP